MNETIFNQILAIRKTGSVNMCDIASVQRLAYQKAFYELVLYIEEEPARYFHFILFGEEQNNSSHQLS